MSDNPAKEAHARILAKMRRRVWFERWCAWCGKEFNQLDSRLTRYCCDKCKAQAMRDFKPREKADRVPKSGWLERFRSMPEWFTAADCAKRHKVDARRVREALMRSMAAGAVERKRVRGQYQWRVL